MAVTVTLEEAQTRLPELIAKLEPSEPVVITRDQRPVAELRPVPGSKPRAKFGSCEGMLTIVAEDEAHLEDFDEYMR